MKNNILWVVCFGLLCILLSCNELVNETDNYFRENQNDGLSVENILQIYLDSIPGQPPIADSLRKFRLTIRTSDTYDRTLFSDTEGFEVITDGLYFPNGSTKDTVRPSGNGIYYEEVFAFLALAYPEQIFVDAGDGTVDSGSTKSATIFLSRNDSGFISQNLSRPITITILDENDTLAGSVAPALFQNVINSKFTVSIVPTKAVVPGQILSLNITYPTGPLPTDNSTFRFPLRITSP